MGWTIAVIKGLSPSTGLHKILMEDECKSSRHAQRRLNPPMIEVVNKEILKLLNVGMIYPISNTKWVSPVQNGTKEEGNHDSREQKHIMVTILVQNG